MHMGKEAKIKAFRRNNTEHASLTPRNIRRSILYKATGSFSIMDVAQAHIRAFGLKSTNSQEATQWAAALHSKKMDWRTIRPLSTEAPVAD